MYHSIHFLTYLCNFRYAHIYIYIYIYAYDWKVCANICRWPKGHEQARHEIRKIPRCTSESTCQLKLAVNHVGQMWDTILRQINGFPANFLDSKNNLINHLTHENRFMLSCYAPVNVYNCLHGPGKSTIYFDPYFS